MARPQLKVTPWRSTFLKKRLRSKAFDTVVAAFAIGGECERCPAVGRQDTDAVATAPLDVEAVRASLGGNVWSSTCGVGPRSLDPAHTSARHTVARRHPAWS